MKRIPGFFSQITVFEDFRKDLTGFFSQKPEFANSRKKYSDFFSQITDFEVFRKEKRYFFSEKAKNGFFMKNAEAIKLRRSILFILRNRSSRKTHTDR